MGIEQKLFDQLPDVRYVAMYRGGEPDLHERAGIDSASDKTSDRFEEILVNPTILTLIRQRGEIDCGGLDYVLIRYGNFFQFVQPIPDGHISVAIDASAEIAAVIDDIRRIVSNVCKS